MIPMQLEVKLKPYQWQNHIYPNNFSRCCKYFLVQQRVLLSTYHNFYALIIRHLNRPDTPYVVIPYDINSITYYIPHTPLLNTTGGYGGTNFYCRRKLPIINKCVLKQDDGSSKIKHLIGYLIIFQLSSFNS